MCAECSSLKSQVQALLDENAAVLERYEITERGRYAAEREVRRLKAQLNGSTTAESQKVKEVCDYHDELWRKAFPKARA
jgi:Tfp pilus assembly protein PilE